MGKYKITYLGNKSFEIEGLDKNSIKAGYLLALIIDKNNEVATIQKIEVGIKEYTIVKICKKGEV